MCNMKETVIPIVMGALGTFQKGFEERLKELKIRGRIETIQTIRFLRSIRILKRILMT